MTTYSTGTVSVTNGSSVVTGAGTSFVANVKAGDLVSLPDGRVYPVGSVNSDTQITLEVNYLGSRQSGADYWILATRAVTVALTQRIETLLSGFEDVKNNAGAGVFGRGRASVPGIRGLGDLDTGVYWPTSNAVALSSAGSEVMRATSSGVAIGKTSPQASLDVFGSGLDTEILRLGANLGANSRIMRIKSPATDSTTDAFVLSTGNSFEFQIDDTQALTLSKSAKVGVSMSPSSVAGLSVAAGSSHILRGYNSAGDTETFRVEADGDTYNTNGAFGSLSDERYKTDIADAASQWDDIKAVRLRNYRLLSEGPSGPLLLGVIAQELSAAGMGGLVHESPVGDGPDTFYSVKTSVLAMKMLGALQEAITRIEALEAQAT